MAEAYSYELEEIVEKYSDMVKRIAYTYLNSEADADDTVQEVFINIIKKGPVFNNENHEKAWLIRATINMCKNKINLFWNRNRCSIEAVAESAVLDEYNEDNIVLDAVMSLPNKYKITVYLFYYEGYSTAEIAAILKKNESTVRSVLHRARKKLKDILKSEYDFE